MRIYLLPGNETHLRGNILRYQNAVGKRYPDYPLKAVRDCNHLLLFQTLYVTRFTTHVSQRNIYVYRETCRVIRNTALTGQSEKILKVRLCCS